MCIMIYIHDETEARKIRRREALVPAGDRTALAAGIRVAGLAAGAVHSRTLFGLRLGEGHVSWALSGRQGGQRFSLYVPQAVVPEVQQAVEQGRQLQELMREAGQRYLAALKRERSLGREFRRKAGKR